MSGDDFHDDEGRALAQAVREALARQRLSRQTLADRARLSISTLEKVLSGRRPFTLATVIRVEEALGVPLRDRLRPEPAGAPAPGPDTGAEFGAYSRAGVSGMEGDYLTLRPSLGQPDAVYAYRTRIAWDDVAGRLAFGEDERTDKAFTQVGFVSIPHQSGHVYLVTHRQGQYRLAVLSRPTIEGSMYGILTTLESGRGAQLTPVATPLALVPMGRLGAAPTFGRIGVGQPGHSDYRAHVDRVADDGFARFLNR